jgi:hypothetical protein
MTVKEVYNEVTNNDALVNSSLYLQNGNKVVRFANHAPRVSNFEALNEGVVEIMYVFVNSGLSEIEMEEICDETLNLYGVINCVYTSIENGEDVQVIKLMIDKFLN